MPQGHSGRQHTPPWEGTLRNAVKRAPWAGWGAPSKEGWTAHASIERAHPSLLSVWTGATSQGSSAPWGFSLKGWGAPTLTRILTGSLVWLRPASPGGVRWGVHAAWRQPLSGPRSCYSFIYDFTATDLPLPIPARWIAGLPRTVNYANVGRWVYAVVLSLPAVHSDA